MPKATPKDELSRLTDEECDFIIQRVLWKLRDATNPIEFFRGMGRGVVFEVSDTNRTKVRDLVRLFAKGKVNEASEASDSARCAETR